MIDFDNKLNEFHNSLKDVYELELSVLLSKLEARGIDTSKLTIVENGR